MLNNANISVSAATLASCWAEAGFKGRGGSLKLSLDATLSLFCFNAALSRFFALGMGFGIPEEMYTTQPVIYVSPFGEGTTTLGFPPTESIESSLL